MGWRPEEHHRPRDQEQKLLIGPVVFRDTHEGRNYRCNGVSCCCKRRKYDKKTIFCVFS